MKYLTDRTIIVVSAAAMVVWASCIAMLWAWALDSSGESILVTISAMLLAVAAVAYRGRALSYPAGWVLFLMRRSLGSDLAVVAGRGSVACRLEGRTLLKLYGAATAAALAGALGSMVLVFLALPLVDLVTLRFGWTPLSWTVFKLAVQWLMLLPMAGGVVALFSMGAVLRRDERRNRGAAIGRDWLTGIALGMTLFAMSWWVGADVLMVAGAMAIVLLLVAWVCVSVGGIYTPSRGFEPRSKVHVPASRTARVVLAFAAVTLILAGQVRLLGDLLGVGMVGRAMWTAASLALLARALKRADGLRRAVSLRESAGAILGVIFIVGIQIALALLCLSDLSVAVVAGLLAAALQGPLVALAGRPIARQRRLFVEIDPGVRQLVAATATGAAVGLLLYLLGGTATFNWLVPALGLAVGCGAALVGARDLAGARQRVIWLTSGAIVLAAMVGGVRAAAAQLSRTRGTLVSGMWLRTITHRASRDALPTFEGSLPTARIWRSAAVTDAMHEILVGPSGRAKHRGRWWVVASSMRDWPNTVGIYVAASMPDPWGVPRSQASGLLLLGPDGMYHQAAQMGQGTFDGVLLAPLAADHPDAWRCYNLRTIQRSRRRLLSAASEGKNADRGEAMMLRTQVADENLHDLFAVVKTFTEVVGDCWAVVEWKGGMVDVLVAGPKMRRGQVIVDCPAPRPGAVVLSAELLWPEETTVRPLRLLKPQGAFRRLPLSANLWYQHLREVAVIVPDEQP
ncbi:hypothetical protein LCGC14_0366600 [marine sediment metagenome]|uniref:Uncharacterized protein n=1 Tax=marine sediment metagenome TaxID=412755 RepID=A0A0F9WEV9_9ZZZZ|nr:hypothetical protein [Phycisphaerae bacterium]